VQENFQKACKASLLKIFLGFKSAKSAVKNPAQKNEVFVFIDGAIAFVSTDTVAISPIDHNSYNIIWVAISIAHEQ
jgi:hypothetical protein